MQQENYLKLTKQQYIDLNVRIQKSLILDFDEVSARESALEDWKIDVEREEVDKGVPIEEEAEAEAQITERAGQSEENKNPASEEDDDTQELPNSNGLEGIKEEEDGGEANPEANVSIKQP